MSLSLEDIDQITKEMEDETKAIKDELFRFCWYMRGGVTITEAYNLSTEDREIIANIIEKNLEITKKTSLPFF